MWFQENFWPTNCVFVCLARPSDAYAEMGPGKITPEFREEMEVEFIKAFNALYASQRHALSEATFEADLKSYKFVDDVWIWQLKNVKMRVENNKSDCYFELPDLRVQAVEDDS